MSIKNFKPYTPSRRAMTTLSFDEITKTTPEKSLLVTLKKTGGRNQQGVITTRHIGGGNKRKYRIIDFKRNKDGVVGKVAAIEYDPNRNANIALIHYLDGEKDTSFIQKDLKLVIRLFLAKMLISSLETLYHSRTFQKVLSFIMLNLNH